MKKIYPYLEILNTLSFYQLCLHTIISTVIIYIKHRLYQLFGNLLNLKGANIYAEVQLEKYMDNIFQYKINP